MLHDSSWTGCLPDITKDDDNIQNFAYYPSRGGASRFLEIRDPNGKLLGFRFPIKDEHLENLKISETILPQVSSHSTTTSPNSQPANELGSATSAVAAPAVAPAVPRRHKRGTFQVKHWGVWADYEKEFRMTKDMEDALDIVNPWVEKNEDLFTELSEVLRMVDPAQYAHCRNHFKEEMGKVLGPDGNPLKPIAGIWHTVALNRIQVGNASSKHIDWKDNRTSYNCIVPWGTWGGGDLVLWPLKMRVEIQEGDGFLFLGGLIAHSVMAIKQGKKTSLIGLEMKLMRIDQGLRNTIDLFIHKSNFDVLKRRKLEEEKRRKHGMRRKDWKKPASKERGEEKVKKKDKERRKLRRRIRKRKLEEKRLNSKGRE